jgi:5'-3' exonuclease
MQKLKNLKQKLKNFKWKNFKLKKPGKRALSIILAVELCLCAACSYEILRTVYIQQQNVKLAATASEVAGTLVNESFVTRIKNTIKKAKNYGINEIEEAYIKRIQTKAKNLEYVAATRSTNIESSKVYKVVQGAYSWSGSKLSRSRGTVTGPNGKETYYNLNMSGVVNTMRRMGNYDAYWVRSDGCKMLGNYVMIAANLSKHPRGSIVKTSVGLAIVCDTGGFAKNNPNQVDIATNW